MLGEMPSKYSFTLIFMGKRVSGADYSLSACTGLSATNDY